MEFTEKTDNLLSLAFDATKEELEASEMLSAGIREDGSWEIIIKYHGDIMQYQSAAVKIETLSFGFAIVTLPESEIRGFLAHPEVEFAEKPKALYAQDLTGNLASCMETVYPAADFVSAPADSERLLTDRTPDIMMSGEQSLTERLAGVMTSDQQPLTERVAGVISERQQSQTGKGVCIGIIDSGMDVTLPCFFTENGKSRVLFFYDQTNQREYSGADIEEVVKYDNNSKKATKNNEGNDIEKEDGSGYNQQILWDPTGHGTQVAVIAAGNGRTADGSVERELIGAAPEASIIAVKLDTKNQKSFPLTTSVMRAFDYILKKSAELNIPTAINLSFGNSYGPHDGTSLLEAYIDEVAQAGRIAICIGTGNEGTSGGHTGGQLLSEERTKSVFFNIGQYQRECNLQLWYSAADVISVSLISPSGESYFADMNTESGRSVRAVLQDTELLIYIGTAHPYSMKRELYISFSGVSKDKTSDSEKSNGEKTNGKKSSSYINSGTWVLRLIPVQIKSGNYNLYLPSAQVRRSDTVFLQPTPELTITIPATAKRAISVGAYNTGFRAYAEFSGRGYVAGAEDNNLFFVKPELAAPGVNILTETAYGREYVTGTSFATSFVTGAAARLMQRGIVDGEDPYLYGEKLKAYLIRNAKKLPSEREEVNSKIGYGALCL